MTLDILSFIDNKGGNAEEIRESQRKRGHSVEIVDEIIQMYTDWVKSTLNFLTFLVLSLFYKDISFIFSGNVTSYCRLYADNIFV